MFVVGYLVIVFLTCYLVALNVHGVVKQFNKDKNVVRLNAYLATLLLSGATIIGLSGAIVHKVIETQAAILLETTEAAIPRYRLGRPGHH